MDSLQSILIPKKYYNKKLAYAWLSHNNFKMNNLDEKQKYYRFRQRDPKLFDKFYIKKLSNNILLIIGRKYN